MSNLVFQTAFLGDLLLSIPLLKNLKRLFPNQPLILVCRPGFGSFFKKINLVDEVYEMNKKDPVSIQEVKSKLLQTEWNYVVNPHESPRTAMILKKVKARKKIAFKKWWNALFFDETLLKPYHLPDALRQLSLLTLIDEDFKSKLENYISQGKIRNPEEQNDYQWAFGELPEWASLQIDFAKRTPQKRVILAPGSVWNTKRWSLDGYEKLAEHFIKNQYEVILIGTKDEQPICQQVVNQVPGAINKAGQTSILELYELMKTTEVLFCNDSGAMHLAAVAGVPTVSIFGPTVLAQGFMPWNSHSVVTQRTLSCRPCGRHGGKSCPIGTHECMKSLQVKDVLGSYQTLTKRLM